MKKKMLTSSLLLLLGSAWQVSAQYIHESSVKFEKNNVNAVVADYNRPEAVMEEALKQHLAQEPLGKPDKSKGYTVYKGVNWSRISKEKVDVYFKVEGSKVKTSVVVLVSKGYGNFITAASDPDIVKGLKDFLAPLDGKAADVQFSIDLSAQQFVIAKAEKEYARSLSDSTDYAMERKKLDARIAAQNEALQSRKKAMDMERAKLSDMKKAD